MLSKGFGARLVRQLHAAEISTNITPRHARSLPKSDQILRVSDDIKTRLIWHLGIDEQSVTVLHNTVGQIFSPGEKATTPLKLGIKLSKSVMPTAERVDPRRNGYKGHARVLNALG